MRRAANVDVIQPETLRCLRQMGASVQPLHQVGGGCVDLLIGFRGVNICIELKDGDKPPSARQLNAEQRKWHAAWNGQKAVAESPEEACRIVIAAAKERGRL